MVFGNERNYVVALVTLDPDALPGWATENGVSGDYTEIVRSDACKAMVQGYVDELNKNLNRWETIKKWELLDHDLTVESGELTPSMKVKRNVVEDNYKDVIAASTLIALARSGGRRGSTATVTPPLGRGVWTRCPGGSSSVCRTRWPRRTSLDPAKAWHRQTHRSGFH